MEYKLPLLVEVELLTSENSTGVGLNMEQVMVKQTIGTITVDIPENYLCAFEDIEAGTKLLKLHARGSECLTEAAIQTSEQSVSEET